MISRKATSGALACLVMMTGIVIAQVEKAGPRYAVVSKATTPALANGADASSTVLTLKKGNVVEIVSRTGTWTEIRVAGGIVAYAPGNADGKATIDGSKAGDGIVRVEGLSLHSRASSRAPSIGYLKRNQRVTLLGQEGAWIKLLAPGDKTLFVATSDIDTQGDQLRLARSFADSGLSRETRMLATGREVKRAAVRQEKDDKYSSELASLDAELDLLLKGIPDTTALTSIRSRYESLARKAGADSAVAQRAERQAAFVRNRENFTRSLDATEARINRLESELKEGERRYESELVEIREETRTRIRSGGKRAKKPRGPFLERGIGEIYKDYGESLTGKPVFILTKAGERRYRIVSDRYDLSEYHSKTIAITKWDLLDDRSGSPWPKVYVKRLEIIN